MKKILCVVDIQKEYNSPNRQFYIPSIEDSLQNASRVLDHARANGWEILHMQHLWCHFFTSNDLQLVSYVTHC